MLFEERLEAAERRRLEGNALFAKGKYKEALAKYALVSNTFPPTHPGSCRRVLTCSVSQQLSSLCHVCCSWVAFVSAVHQTHPDPC